MQTLIPAQALAPHLQGSYEATSGAVREALQRSDVFGLSKRVAVVATHPEHVVAVVEATGVFRVPYVLASNGEVAFGNPVEVEAQVVRADSIGSYVESVASSVVDALLRGDSEQARDGSASLLPLVTPAMRAARGNVFEWSRAGSVWRHLFARISTAALTEGQDIFGPEPIEASKREAVEARTRQELKKLQDLMQALRDRYSDANARAMHEGPDRCVGELTLSEMASLFEGIHSEVFTYVTRITEALQATPPATVTDLARHADSAARAIQPYTLALASVDAIFSQQDKP